MSDAFDYFIAVHGEGPSEYVVKINGPIDLRDAGVLQEALLDGLVGAPTRLIVNLAAVSSIDPSGLDLLVGAHRRSAAFGTELVFGHANAEVAELIERNGLATAAEESRSSVNADRQRRPFPHR